MDDEYTVSENPVSTHSRLKAAGDPLRSHGRQYFSFNTQPPEGGWIGHRLACRTDGVVSTHSRLKAAGWIVERKLDGFTVSTHSRLKAAGSFNRFGVKINNVSTHSRLKAAGRCCSVW